MAELVLSTAGEVLRLVPVRILCFDQLVDCAFLVGLREDRSAPPCQSANYLCGLGHYIDADGEVGLPWNPANSAFICKIPSSVLAHHPVVYHSPLS